MLGGAGRFIGMESKDAMAFESVSREASQARIDRCAQAAMRHRPSQSYTIADRFEDHADERPNAPFLFYQDREYRFQDINQEANLYAAAAAKLGMKIGDTAALMMENRPEFFSVYLGLAKIGVKIALINTNTRDAALLHAFEATQTKLVFLGAECAKEFSTLKNIAGCPPAYVIPDGDKTHPDMAGADPVAPLLVQGSVENPPKALRADVKGDDVFFYIFTSGTTGLPKAARLSHMRWLNAGEFNDAVLEIDGSDVFYSFLPLYHGAAGMSLVSAALVRGRPIVLRRRFSTSQFWPEVRKYNVTTTQYIGEICRYLLTPPPKADDADNPLRKMTGAGLSPSVWKEFQTRFGVEKIFEGYGGTESNAGVVNLDMKVGAVGRIPFKEKSNARLIRIDDLTGDAVRDENGHCIECGVDEPGELIGMILDLPDLAAGHFEGYTDAEASQKKILKNPFGNGASWFRSGDMLKCDADDYYYFVDRLGDTFRWKSENVSTTEVADALSGFPGSMTFNIYGVLVPDQEGRAGMAAIQMMPEHDFNPRKFHRFCKDRLPKYAVPVFVRISNAPDLTSTFKLRKVDLQREGYDPDLVSEPVWVLDEQAKTYIGVNDANLRRLGLAAFQSN